MLTNSFKAHKQAMQSSCKIILAAGVDITRGKYDDAIFTLSRAIVSDPSSRLAHLVRGRAYYCLGEDDKAVNDFSTVVAGGDKQVSLYVKPFLNPEQYYPTYSRCDSLRSSCGSYRKRTRS